MMNSSFTNVRLKRTLGAVCCVLIVVSAFVEGAAAGISVEARGLQIVGAGIGKDNNELRPFNWTEGTTLALLVLKPSGGLVSFSKKKSELKLFVDNKGTNLLKKKKSKKTTFSFVNTGFGSMPSFSKDKKGCMIEIKGAQTPKKSSTAIMATGTLSFQCASKTKDFKQKDIALKEGTKIKAGPIPFTIKKTGKPQWGDDEMSVTLEAKQDLSSVKEIKFVDSEGKEIPTKSGGSSRMSFGGNVQIEKGINFKKKAEKATIVITYWTDMKVVSTPFKIKTSVGL